MNDLLRRTPPPLSSASGRNEMFESMRSRTFCQHRMVVTIERVILGCHSPVTVPPAGTVNYFKVMPREKVSPGPETVQLFAGVYYMGDTNLPEYPYMARRS